MLFASLVFERMPLIWNNLPDGLVVWVQNAGGVSAFGIALVLAARALQRDPNELNVWNLSDRMRSLLPVLKACIIASGIGYAALVLIWVGDRMTIPGLKPFLPRDIPGQPFRIGDWILTLSGALALLVALTPILIDLTTRISLGRIWAIARLSWKEAVRGRVVWVFGAMALVFLFAGWFVPAKAEDQLRSYVRIVYWSMTPLFLITAALLGSFSIPNDVKNNSIHTIVTKPVEKFEIVLGRFLGYAGLLTIGLFLVSSLSLIYVIRGVNEEAAQESLKARIPLYGDMQFAGTKGENVGREWTYRSYITGPTKYRREGARQYAIWDFEEIPAAVRERDAEVIFEFAFDIFRLSKGKQGEGVYCTFTFADAGAFGNSERGRQANDLEGRTDEMKKDRDKRQAVASKKSEKDKAARSREFEQKKAGKGEAQQQELDELYEKEMVALDAQYVEELKQIDVDLVAQYHIYQATGKEVTDFHTQEVVIPIKEFRALLTDVKRPKDGENPPPALRVFVSVDVADQAQMVGVAPQDFYLLAHVKPFWQNFLKGVLGMWCTHMLVLAIAIACSTYLSSVISLLITLFLYLFGLNLDYLRQIAEHRVEGGGPFEASMRLTTKMGPGTPLDDSPTKTLITAIDSFFSWWVGRVLNLIPDISRHDLHQYVANGFDISWFDVLLIDNGLPLFGYLLPWAILAYYLMKYREIANPQ